MACSICGRETTALGLCSTHYQRLRKHGDPLWINPRYAKRRVRQSATCSVDGCPDEIQGQGLCRKHYARLLRNGHPTVSGRPTLLDRFCDRWEQGPPWYRNGRRYQCWIWTGNTTKGGYGLISDSVGAKGRTKPAHRVSYEIFRGPIPPGMQIDHFLFCNTRCVNPAHLEVVTPAENQRRSIARAMRDEKGRIHGFSPSS